MSDIYLKSEDIDKEKIRGLLRYGDRKKIALRCGYSYEYVAKVLKGDFDNRDIWLATAQYIDSLPKASIKRRTADMIKRSA